MDATPLSPAEPLTEPVEAIPETPSSSIDLDAERAHWARSAEAEGVMISPDFEVTDEVREQFRATFDKSLPGSRRMHARLWLSGRGLIVDRPVPEATETTTTHAAAIHSTKAAPPVVPVGELPSHPVVENGVLGRLILSHELIAETAGLLTPNDFHSAERARLWAKIRDLHERGISPTAVMIENEFTRTGMASLAARDLVADAIREACPPGAVPGYCTILREYAYQRAQIVAAKSILAGVGAGKSSKDALDRARSILDRVDDATGDGEAPPIKLRKWPEPIAEAAYHGLAGEFVRLVAPRTEADPVAVLAQFLISFGSIIGHKAHCSIDATKHYCNEFMTVVGLTARGRKGTSWEVTKLAFANSDPTWAKSCHYTGISSGEAIVHTVRDPVFKTEKHGNEMLRVLVDAGTEDKRALWVEDEFASVIARMQTEGSTLSANIRKAWQSGDLQNMNKQSPCRSTGAHISMIGHITFDELERCLGQKEIGNGFANRFLWICAKRAQLLPMGGGLLSKEFRATLDPLADRISQAIDYATDDLFGEIAVGMSEEATSLFHASYARLSRTRLGNLGAVTDRAEAHVRRLAMIYALLDKSPIVELVHLHAALAFWDYSERSVRFIFGNEDVDPLAEKVLSVVAESGDEGVGQNVIARKLFSGRNREEVGKALAALTRACLIQPVERRTKGRPATFWVACR